ncbi:preprotein translocase subunit YajC [Amycolatopsis rubida]|uniref:Preprotein translocase subunit YajC n=1 Tax=Amycolatopsis rubida TaxID=112413 RepID=A0ABX0C0R1_9PSEU|nr:MULTISPECIES: preprotein translocase subunit YajC [Amycolatopsis]MYW95753.1 preprotein translocase subunit YajC [Amycolatopsis rubida]NEC60743.1 preprotein translocase subunit YajC [Amycolatopsis rubida]OAP26932.1 preprotein translocase subunit YajC [Amycolatopsis sp. M39]
MNQLLLPLLLLLVVAVPLVMGTRKQKKQQAAQQEMQNSISAGDRVMTTSGMYGTVADTSSETTIDIEIAPGVVTTWLRLAVREKVEPAVETEENEDSAETEVAGIESAPAASSEAPAQESISAEEKQTSGAQVAPPLEHGKK